MLLSFAVCDLINLDLSLWRMMLKKFDTVSFQAFSQIFKRTRYIQR